MTSLIFLNEVALGFDGIVLDQVELAEVPEVGVGEAFSEFSRKGAGKFRKQSIAIACFRSTALFFLHDPPADLPVSGEHSGIDGGVGGAPGIGKDAAHVGEKSAEGEGASDMT